MRALESIVFLPDQLFEECLSQTGESATAENIEFSSSMMYTEQILRVFPREFTARLRMGPAFEETLMRYDESKGGSKGAGAAKSMGNFS